MSRSPYRSMIDRELAAHIWKENGRYTVTLEPPELEGADILRGVRLLELAYSRIIECERADELDAQRDARKASKQ
ncbi:hypothetical protein OB2597_06680 [Pseudooceanicola batsensis HTCC2597]|uniref:Uncharacterized protein n=1 Tax=Pseudooceanicola batsensis (strain ATCC BAA-863 / DSM 15984 / KCTC 12145 / HTCC2597) TaxID=252305 RepID=A3TTH1_PSEBH|nr:hypothetical protein [Pseudooceanicola batsensis]EAQ04948.1 hypothetical protein OB2597_06680 [Pseudooceanicola batsensis HTCC2597]